MSNLHYSLLLGASACVQLSQFEEAITWCEKGLAVSFIAEPKTKNIINIQTSFRSLLLCTTEHNNVYKNDVFHSS